MKDSNADMDGGMDVRDDIQAETVDEGEGMPFFQLDPRDRHTAGTIRDYLSRLWSDNQVSDEYKDQTVERCREIERWQKEHPEQVVTPSQFGEIREA